MYIKNIIVCFGRHCFYEKLKKNTYDYLNVKNVRRGKTFRSYPLLSSYSKQKFVTFIR